MDYSVAYQAPLSMEFSRKKYCIGLPFPSPGDLLDQGIKPWSPALRGDAFPSGPPGKPNPDGRLTIRSSCVSWTRKQAACGSIDGFELWCWRTLSTVPWTAKRSNQSILKEISPEYSLEGLRLNEAEDPILWPPDGKS